MMGTIQLGTALFLQVDPKFLRNMRFAKKHNKKGLKKMKKTITQQPASEQPMEQEAS